MGAIGLLAFPPPDLSFTFPGFSLGAVQVIAEQTYSVSWTGAFMFAVLLTIGIVILVNLANTSFLGSGLNLDAKYISTIIVAFIMSGFVGFTLMAMMSTLPLLFSIFLVWVPLISLVYSVVTMAGGGE